MIRHVGITKNETALIEVDLDGVESILYGLNAMVVRFQAKADAEAETEEDRFTGIYYEISSAYTDRFCSLLRSKWALQGKDEHGQDITT